MSARIYSRCRVSRLTTRLPHLSIILRGSSPMLVVLRTWRGSSYIAVRPLASSARGFGPGAAFSIVNAQRHFDLEETGGAAGGVCYVSKDKDGRIEEDFGVYMEDRLNSSAHKQQKQKNTRQLKEWRQTAQLHEAEKREAGSA